LAIDYLYKRKCKLLLFCSPAVTCPALSAPENGMISCSPSSPPPVVERSLPHPEPPPSEALSDSNPGDVCVFSCEDDYKIIGSDTRTCGDDGAWSGTLPICESTYAEIHYCLVT